MGNVFPRIGFLRSISAVQYFDLIFFICLIDFMESNKQLYVAHQFI